MQLHALAFCPLPSALCPLSSVLCPLSSVLCPLCLSVCLCLSVFLCLCLCLCRVFSLLEVCRLGISFLTFHSHNQEYSRCL